jgi:hypothetical protein
MSLLRALVPSSLLLLVWLGLRSVPEAVIERVWVHGVLPATAAPLVAVQDAVGVSASIVSIVVFVALLAFGVIAPGRGRRLGYLAAAVLAWGPAFEVSFGLGYRRAPLEAVLALPNEAPSLPEAWSAFDAVVALLEGGIAQIAAEPLPGVGWVESLEGGGVCIARLDAALSGRSTPLPVPRQMRILPEGTLLSAGFAGIVGPWLREPHVDGGLPGWAWIATAMHELGHTLGWAREAETDAIATLAGLGCEEPRVRVAAAIHAVHLLAREIASLAGGDVEARAALAERIAALPRPYHAAVADAREASQRYFRPMAAQVTTATYAAYLRTQGAPEGMADYARAGSLLLALLLRCSQGDACPIPLIPPGGMLEGERPAATTTGAAEERV